MVNRAFTVIVEGNIGAGKSTFLEQFQQNDGVEVFSEPVDNWRNVGGHNLLRMLYSHQIGIGFLFQTFAQLTMLRLHVKDTAMPVKLMERSMLSARYCFIENLHRRWHLSHVEYTVLNEWFKFLSTHFEKELRVDLIVYLRSKPRDALSRIMKRGREEEKGIGIGFLEDLHDLHEDWLVRKTKFQPLPAPVLVVDVDSDLTNMEERYKEIKKQILEMSLGEGMCPKEKTESPPS